MSTEKVREEHGAPCWVELTTTDPEASAAFYGKLFGWSATTMEMQDGSGIYTCFKTKSGKEVAGAMKPQEPSIPNHWGSYIHVDDVDAAVATAVEAGGKVLHPAFDCPDVGRIAYIQDPQGAALALITMVETSCSA